MINSLEISIILLTGILLLLPGRKTNVELLRQYYIKALQSYQNTTYIWGGENRLGIDCSGLIRQGLIKANLQLGLTTVNPSLLRQALSLWWYDASAEALRDQYREYTIRGKQFASINEINYSQIQPGDLAVTTDGVHILAYLGQQTWIEADPNYGKVITVKVPDLKNPWFQMPVYLLRWQQFQIN